MEILNSTAFIAATIFGILSIIFGAFGAHLLKKHMSKDSLESFETGVKYQIYHALLLLIISILPQSKYVENAALLIILGIILFSFSIYGLTLSSTFGKKIRFLGPITPIGGILLTAGWLLLLFSAI